MRSRAAPVFGAAFILFAVSAAAAQEPKGEIISAFRDRAVVLDIVARVLEREETEIWNATSSRVTIPGRPVSIKLVGANVVVLVQFTPYKRDDGRQVLVAQGQVWVNTKDAGMRYQTTMETIPIEFGERVYYFPLGSNKGNNEARIEIQIELKPYQGEGDATTGVPEDAKPSADAKPIPEPKSAPQTKATPEMKTGDAKPSAKDTAKALVTEGGTDAGTDDLLRKALPGKSGSGPDTRKPGPQTGEERPIE